MYIYIYTYRYTYVIIYNNTMGMKQNLPINHKVPPNMPDENPRGKWINQEAK